MTHATPTHVCVPIMVEEPGRAELDAILAAEKGADLIEYRVDALITGEHDEETTESHLAALRAVIEDAPRPAIVTLRDASEGGGFEGTDALRAHVLETLCSGNLAVSYVDVEYAKLSVSQALREAVRGIKASRSDGPRLIASCHDFKGRPADLSRRLLAMQDDADVDVIKVAYRARSLRDNLDLFELLRERSKPMVAIGMGEFGLMSRVLAGKFGGFLTFASLRDESATAPGQATIDDMLGMYRFRSIGRQTKVYGVMGWPVGHSLSPLVHNAGFEAAGMDAVYLPMPIAADEGDAEATRTSFRATVTALMEDVALGFGGASVTMPFKGHLARMASAEGWGGSAEEDSLNTLAKTGEGFRVANTDASAIVDRLVATLGGSLEGRRVGFVGAGGVARAAAPSVRALGAHVVVYNRTIENAERLAHDVRAAHPDAAGNVAAVSMESLPKACCDAFINCTPIGMKDGPDEEGLSIPVAEMGEVTSETVFFDTVYAPVETPMIVAARARGCRVIDGVEMFVRQAAAQSEMWTGRPADVDRFDALCRERLSRS